MHDRNIRVAAVQMNAQPQALEHRLQAAENYITQAAAQGAEIVLLPEVFNTGYTYAPTNFARAETIDGPTVIWMKEQTARFNIYLAGSLLLRDSGEIFNTMLLVSPKGQLWRYDKTYPWAWERAYFTRSKRGITVAETPLGRFGMLICWDAMHPTLWQQYAGQIDMMLVVSCPPRPHEFTLIFDDGSRYSLKEGSALYRYSARNAGLAFGDLLRQQAAHLGVPVVNTTAGGVFHTHLPAPQIAMLGFTAMHPALWRKWKAASRFELETPFFHETYIADASGHPLTQVQSDEGICTADVTLTEPPNHPGPNPDFGLSPLAYFLFDRFVPAVMGPLYRRALRE